MKLGLLAVAAALVLGLVPAASAHDVRDGGPSRLQVSDSIPLPLVTSPNVRFVTNVPETQAISGAFAHTAPLFYVSSLDSISVFDVSDPLRPSLTGTLANLVVEGEAMSYGERKTASGVSRFLLVGNDRYNASADGTGGVQPGRIGGGEVIVVDVTDSSNPHVRSRTRATTSTHTVTCLDVSCRFAYTAGDRDRFSIIDLRNLDEPKEFATAASTAAKPNAAFPTGAGHHWDLDAAGIGWHTGSGGIAAFDLSNPTGPRALAATSGSEPGYNDALLHNSARPNAPAFAPNAPPSFRNGNVLLVTEQDRLHDGDELFCDRAGSFQTWHVKRLSGSGSLAPLDKVELADLRTWPSPIGGFCSAHWFDDHPSGIAAVAFHQGGLQLIDVRDPRDLKPYGHATLGASEVWEAYWVPEYRRTGVATGRKTNVVYTTDLVRGLDVYTVDLPGPG